MSLAELYSRAISSGNLKLQEDACDADMLIAAGWSAFVDDPNGGRKVDPARELAVSLYRLKWQYHEHHLRSRERKGARKSHRPALSALTDFLAPKLKATTGLHHTTALDIARRTLHYWLNAPVCKKCQGRKHPLMGDQLVDETRDCVACKGTGKRLVEQAVYSEHREHARWVASYLDRMMGSVTAAMAAVRNRTEKP